ncbi:MAG TPA: hypothetical protein VJ781_03585 [Pyrinomonadaceae bacterium]|nr:hypothetical protein [Pyrinomonadaceae bacterium]
MKIFGTSLLVIAAILMSGCAPSLNPYYLERDLIFNQCLIGKWTDLQYKDTWHFERRGPKKYRVTQVNEDGETTLFEAALFQVDGKTFLDLTPIKNPENYGPSLLRTHSLMAIAVETDKLRISYIDPNWLKGYLARYPETLKHTFVDNEIVITDTTENLQSLIRRSANSPGIFGQTEEVIRQGENK